MIYFLHSREPRCQITIPIRWCVVITNLLGTSERVPDKRVSAKFHSLSFAESIIVLHGKHYSKAGFHQRIGISGNS